MDKSHTILAHLFLQAGQLWSTAERRDCEVAEQGGWIGGSDTQWCSDDARGAR